MLVVQEKWRVERRYVREPELRGADRFRAFGDLILKGALRAARKHQLKGAEDDCNECSSMADQERR